MAQHQAIYRKWRPTVFEDIVGQRHITQTLKNQIIKNKISHAYLFCGTRGTGKTTCAKVLSRAVNCLNPKDGSPCNECAVCKGILDGSIMDVKEIDAASNNGVDNIREIRDDVRYVSANTRYTVYIIDEVHMLSQGAFNALLKTLEEPPENVIFILATTEAHKLPQTILSRCQRFDFKRIRPEDIILRMKEIALGDNLQISEDGYAMLARLADGSMRDGLSVLERVLSATDGEITAETIENVLGISDDEQIFSITDAVISNDINKILSIIDSVLSDGKDLKVFTDSVIAHFRDLLIISVSQSADGLLDYSADTLVKLKAQSERITFEKISNAIRVLSDAQSDAKWVKSPRVIFELAFIKLARPEIDSAPEALLDRLTTVEHYISEGGGSQSGSVPPDLERRLTELESKIENGATVSEKPPEKKTVKKPSAPPIRLYNPIPERELTAANPIVKHAKNWNNITRIILNSAPYLDPVLRKRNLTVDADGIILIFKKSEKFVYDIAASKRDEIIDKFRFATRSDYIVKIAYEDDLSGVPLINVWTLPEGDIDAKIGDTATKTGDASNTGNASNTGGAGGSDEGAVPGNGIGTASSDPLDELTRKFPSIVENADEGVFLTYNSADDNFSQSTLDDDGSEEFLEGDELPSDE